MKEVFGVVIAICGHCATVWAGGYMPAPSRHYSNLDYEFSVEIPVGLLGCVTKETNNGVDILLDRHLSCDDDYRNRRFVDVSANYNTAGEASTPSELAKVYCRDDEAREIFRLKGWRLGGRSASGCRVYFNSGIIIIKLMTLRKTDPRNPEVWITVNAQLTTSSSRYAQDMRLFRKIVRTIRIAPDGPLK